MEPELRGRNGRREPYLIVPPGVPLEPGEQEEGDPKVEFAYDYTGRRIEKNVYDWDAMCEQGQPDPLLHRKFVWSGRLMLLELEGSTGVPPVDTTVRKYTWGLDLAGQKGDQSRDREGAGMLEAAGLAPLTPRCQGRTGRTVAAGVSPAVGSVGVSPANWSVDVSPANWNIVETRNGSNQATAQWVWGQGGTGILPVSYVDELILMDVNGDPTESNDCDPDDQAGESTTDERYFCVQDRQPLTQRRPRRGHGRRATAELRSGRRVKGNWNVVALTGYDPTGEGDGDIVECYAYTPYGEFIVLNTAASELGNVLPTSTVGNPFAHQGLPFDAEKRSYQNRRRERPFARFSQRDPLGYADALSQYVCLGVAPVAAVDPLGLKFWGCVYPPWPPWPAAWNPPYARKRSKGQRTTCAWCQERSRTGTCYRCFFPFSSTVYQRRCIAENYGPHNPLPGGVCPAAPLAGLGPKPPFPGHCP